MTLSLIERNQIAIRLHSAKKCGKHNKLWSSAKEEIARLNREYKEQFTEPDLFWDAVQHNTPLARWGLNGGWFPPIIVSNL